MEMTLRWYGSKFDTVTLKQIRQHRPRSRVAADELRPGPCRREHRRLSERRRGRLSPLRQSAPVPWVGIRSPRSRGFLCPAPAFVVY